MSLGVAASGYGVVVYRLLALKMGLSLELKGIKATRGKTVYSILKSQYGFRGSRESVLSQLESLIEEEKLKLEPGDIVSL